MQLSDFSTLVIIADSVSMDKSKVTVYSREVDMAYEHNVKHLKEGFEHFIDNVIVYSNPQTFLQNVQLHKNDIIFPYWHGKSSRNKHALVASVCEIENLVYIGPDTYTNIICCDKIISKDICRLAGVKFPRCVVINDESQKCDWPYKLPAVVKPVYEGSSVGITQDNLVTDASVMEALVRKLYQEFRQPIMIEEFIPGIEVNLAFIGWKNHIKVWSAARRVHLKNPSFFDTSLFAFSEKNLEDDITLADARDMISTDLLQKLTNLFSWLDKIEFIRIDGKIYNNEFYCIELTQDADLHPEGSFFTQLQYAGYNFRAALQLMVENCLERYNNLDPTQS